MPALQLSVVMPMHNAAPFVEAAIDSILAQTWGAFAFYIVDDGSTDGSGEIAASRAASDPRIHLIRQENRGIVASLNTMLALVDTPFVARMDADDIALPERFATQLAHMQRRPSLGALGSQFVEIDELGRRRHAAFRHPVGRDAVHAGLERYQTVANPTVMFRTDALRAAGLYRPAFGYCEDYDLFLRLSEIADIDNLPDILMLYRRTPGQMSVANNAMQSEQAAYARLAHQMRKAGKRDPFAEMAVLPSPRELETMPGMAGVAKTLMAEIASARRYAVATMDESEFAELLRRLSSGVPIEAPARAVVRCLAGRRFRRAARLAGALIAGLLV